MPSTIPPLLTIGQALIVLHGSKSKMRLYSVSSHSVIFFTANLAIHPSIHSPIKLFIHSSIHLSTCSSTPLSNLSVYSFLLRSTLPLLSSLHSHIPHSPFFPYIHLLFPPSLYLSIHSPYPSIHLQSFPSSIIGSSSSISPSFHQFFYLSIRIAIQPFICPAIL